MIVNLLARLGRGMNSRPNEIKIPFGCSVLYADFNVVIDDDGKLLAVENVKREDSKTINPIALIDGVPSEAFSGKYIKPHLFYLQNRMLITESKEIYLQGLKDFYDYMPNKYIGAIISFVESNAKLDIEKEDAVIRFVVLDKLTEKRVELWKEKEIVRQASSYIWDRISQNARHCDVIGDKASGEMTSCIKLRTGSPIKTNLMPSTAYNLYYHGRYEDSDTVKIALSTDLECMQAYYNIKQQYTPKGYSRWFYFGTDDGSPIAPIDLSIKGFELFYKLDAKDDLFIEKLYKAIEKRASGRGIIYLEFDAINKGRVSTYNAFSYGIKESKDIIQAIKNWIEISIKNDDKGVYQLLKPKNIVDLIAGKETVIINELYSKFFKSVITKKYKEILDWYVKLPNNPDPYNVYELSQLYPFVKGSINMENIRKTNEYKLGELYAWACLAEKKYNYRKETNYTVIQDYKDVFFRRPDLNWARIRQLIDEYIKDDYRDYSKIMLNIQIISNELSKSNGFNNRALGGKALIAMDCVFGKYWEDIRKKENGTDE
ncbi:type I-C CRISPR-associated protein Cas8c/Csd1 [Pseudobutyrivibrio sp. LB2011]|uniref:type I-C CRISPR-associated protein Cas8c/Csd1 n=1 Tax=Pseudobutyrivibrio sp. LB2011 TaxID=1408312 RepID=UPI0005D2173A|nr:type I-C CRISPR-associated protein Cas8c/Csd1 [Pseudobutyrivibrio sp. LB2011]